jgi:hypothetical protein
MEICETCDRVSEVFQLPGRKDRNCRECSADIAMLISLNALMNCGQLLSAELESKAKPIIRRMLVRCTTAKSYSCNSSGPPH